MKIQINDEIRNATPDETAVINQIQKDAAAHIAALEAAAAAKTSARVKLAALGLTDAEIAAFLGA